MDTIWQVIQAIKNVSLLILYLYLASILWGMVAWLLKTFVLVKRGYFYEWDYDGEKYKWLGRNKKWAIPKMLLGYVRILPLQQPDDEDAFAIIDVQRFGDQKIGYVKVEKGKADRAYVIVKRKLEENDYYKIGFVDLEGRIYKCETDGSNPIQIGICRESTNGKTWWKTLFLWMHIDVFLTDEDGNDLPGQGKFGVGCCSETGRFYRFRNVRGAKEHTLLARAGAALLLWDSIYHNWGEDSPRPSESIFDTALLAIFCWLPLFVGYCYINTFVHYNLFPFLGTELSFTFSAVVFYFFIWYILHQIKVFLLSNSDSILKWLKMLNGNTGIADFAFSGIVMSAIGIALSTFFISYSFMAFFIVIFIGLLVNRSFFNPQSWEVKSAFVSHIVNYEQPGGGTEKEYQWKTILPYREVNGFFTICFNDADVELIRERNPFMVNNQAARSLYKATAKQLIADSTANNYVAYSLNKIMDVCVSNNLTLFEEVQVVLSFVQEPSIVYAHDNACAEIRNFDEYFRHAVETLYDKRGDCDCKSILAASLFKKLGYGVLFLSGQGHAAIAIESGSGYGFEEQSLEELGVVKFNNRYYYYCETTGENWKVGQKPTVYSIQAFTNTAIEV